MGLEVHYEPGQTPLDEDEKGGLLIKTISTHQELDEFEQANIEKAVEWSIHAKLREEKILSENFIKSLHKRMFGDVWDWAGSFRRSNKNIGCEWSQIGVDLRNLIDDTKFWIANGTFGSEEISIRFKHRIVSIHCFPNGNGRHSRLMADILMDKVFGRNVFSWGQSSIRQADLTRKQYIIALRRANEGQLQELIDFAKG